LLSSTLTIDASMTRIGVALEPNGDPSEEEGVLNPASARTRDGRLLLYPRAVAKGNQSRISLVEVIEDEGKQSLVRRGFALQPEAPYEFGGSEGNGCEDARVTFIKALDRYVMSYTAYGKQGPAPAIAISDDGFTWQKLGLISFPAHARLPGGDKDVAFFPEPVYSPAGVESLALYHRPMALIPPQGTAEMLAMPHAERDSIWLAYIPLQTVKDNISNLTKVSESYLLLAPSAKDAWGQLKLGGGTVPISIDEGWLSIYHGVDAVEKDGELVRVYRAGIIIHDHQDISKIVYRSPEPLLSPAGKDELVGIVGNVVFPTALEPRPDLGKRVFDIYYGMADFKIGLARLELK
jgi:beta-1,2-mannobiose phosphorylase / 1,2-beta-oligomannan phosphorylase